MKVFKICSFSFLLFLACAAQGQTNWSLRTSLGTATENNLGDSGLRLSSRVSRHYGKWSAFAQAGFFQMFQTHGSQTGPEGYLHKRSLSTVNLDLGGSFTLVNQSRVKLSGDAGGTYRIGRQLWPEFAQTINGHREDFYTYEKLSEIGYVLGLDFSVKVSDRFWVSLDAHCHNYNFFGEYIGLGLGATILF